MIKFDYIFISNIVKKNMTSNNMITILNKQIDRINKKLDNIYERLYIYSSLTENDFVRNIRNSLNKEYTTIIVQRNEIIKYIKECEERENKNAKFFKEIDDVRTAIDSIDRTLVDVEQYD